MTIRRTLAFWFGFWMGLLSVRGGVIRAAIPLPALPQELRARRAEDIFAETFLRLPQVRGQYRR
jgi:hypothetical protein